MSSTSPERLFVYAAPGEARALAGGPASLRGLEIGVGAARAAMNLTRALMLGPPPALLVSVGVCGVYPARLAGGAAPCSLAVGDLAVVAHDVFADEGVDTEQGFVGMPAMGLVAETGFTAPPALVARVAAALSLPPVRAATVSTCSATDARARALMARTGARIETMEGAAVALVCARFALPWLQVRAVSNECGDRGRAGWDLDRAVSALAAVVPALAALELT